MIVTTAFHFMFNDSPSMSEKIVNFHEVNCTFDLPLYIESTNIKYHPCEEDHVQDIQESQEPGG